MAITANQNGAILFKPGVYSKSTVSLSGGFPFAPTGVVAIVGEADGGAPGSVDGVQTFTSEDLASLKAKYVSGPICDAASMLVAPARDARVANGASMIRVYKTNAATAASLSLGQINLTSANYGADQNLIGVQVSAGAVNPNARIVTVTKGTQKEILPENALAAMLQIHYTGSGSAASMTIQNGVLATTCTGDTANNLSINLANKTIQDVVDLISANSSYVCSTSLKLAKSTAASRLDPISTPSDIMTAAKTLVAQTAELVDIINANSVLVKASAVANMEGTIAVAAKKLMSGAARGASSNSSFQAGFDALLSKRCNIIIPLVSQDASALASQGLTDSASTFTVDAVNLQAVTHCITASNTKNRSERNCYVSKKASFAATMDAAQNINHERASMTFQDVQVLGSSGDLVWQDPWAAACMVAGIQAGTDVGTPATFKMVNANGIRHQDYNPKTQADLAIQAGLLPLEEKDSGGFRVVVQNTTYSTDANFVYNRAHVLAACDTVAYNLRQQLEDQFIGEKAKTGSAKAIENAVIAQMSNMLAAELIVGDDTNNGLGWKDLIVTLTGNTAVVKITITPVQGIDFILPNITLDNIRQSA